jgi:O-methyltransferase
VSHEAATARRLYLELMKRVLTRIAFEDETMVPGSQASHMRRPLNRDDRTEGRDLPAYGETMIGLRRLDNIQYAVETVLQGQIPGDLIETGVWRGGATIFMRATLAAYAERTRTVWVADSFQGLPQPDPIRFPHDVDDQHHSFSELAISLDEVQSNFARYGLLDEQVRFLPGWFRDTLPNAPIGRLAVLRLDGDMYESTLVALESLYPKVSPGGFVIVDDYGGIPACRAAVDDFRSRERIDESLTPVDWTGVYWRRGAEFQ